MMDRYSRGNRYVSLDRHRTETHGSRGDRRARPLGSRVFHPGVGMLEERMLLSATQPEGATAAGTNRASVAEFVRFRTVMMDRGLEIYGTSGADTVEIGRSARGLVTLKVNGETYSADPRDRATYDRRLAGVRVDSFRSVRLFGSDSFDTIVLSTAHGNGQSIVNVQSQAVALAATANMAGTLNLVARTITVSAMVQADSIVMNASGLLNLEAGGSLSAAKSIDLTADRLIQTGNLSAPAVTVQASVAIRSGTIMAPGGSVSVNFTEHYMTTQDAAIDVSSSTGPGGSIRIDGGTSGHFFSSGTLLARGGISGGEIRASGKDVVWVGGGWQGGDATMSRAGNLRVSPHTRFTADGPDSGGTVVLWSDVSTTNYGTISARGGNKGGAVEVSSKASLAHGGSVEVGPGGQFLLDPKNIVIADNVMGGVPMFELVNPTPNVNDSFGASIVPLSTGNVVVPDPGDDAVATDAGAVYLFNGATGVLISTLTGSTAKDQVGIGGVTALSNDNYVVRSTSWDNGAATDAGAVTWGSGISGALLTGLVGVAVSAASSIVGIGSNPPISDTVIGTCLIRRSTSGGAVYVGLTTRLPHGVTFAANSSETSNMSPAFVAASLSAGTATTLQASNDITLSNALTVNNTGGSGGEITLQAGRSVTFNANITTDDGNLTVLANAPASAGVVDAQRDAGAGGVTVTASITINAGAGVVTLSAGAATGLTNRTSGGVSIAGTVSAGSVSITTADSGAGTPDVSITGSVAATGAGGITLNSAGAVTFGTSGTLTTSASTASIAITGTSISLRNTISTTNGQVTYTGPVTLSGPFDTSTGNGVSAFANSLAVGSQSATFNTSAVTTVAGTLSLNGGVLLAITAGISVGSSGSLTGNGTIIGATSVAGGLAPGSGATGIGNGILYVNAGALTLAATSTMTMNGTSKSAFDKIIANGINLAGATLSLDLSGATLATGDAITLVDNVSGSATSGTFAGRPRGGRFSPLTAISCRSATQAATATMSSSRKSATSRPIFPSPAAGFSM